MFPGNVVGKHTDTHKTDTGEGSNDGTTAATAHLAKASSAAVDTTPLPALESKRNWAACGSHSSTFFSEDMDTPKK